jgi:shikimate dehydrogenase
MRTYGLIGFPLSHSFSQTYFTHKFEQLKIANAQYKNFPLHHISELSDLLRNESGLSGFNVTIPYKEAIMHYLHEVDDLAQNVGAVNCVKISNQKLIGYNTDVFGFEMSIKPFLENKYERALILGTGGASKAVAFVLSKWNIPFHYATRMPMAENHIAYQDLSADNIKFFQLIINCTPLGTAPNVLEHPPLPYHALTEKHFLYDLIYNPAQTEFLKKGAEQGAHTMNGLKMLELQAERSWEIWNS